jgi:hypothetical protein
MKTYGQLKNPPEPDRLWRAKIFHPTWSGCHQERSYGSEEKSGILSMEFPGGDAPRPPPFLVSLGARLCTRYLPNLVLVRYVAWFMQVAQPDLAGAFPKTAIFCLDTRGRD